MLARIEGLLADLRQVLLALVDPLAEKAGATLPQPGHRFNFDWEADLGDAYVGTTSVELQHRATARR